MITTLFHTYVIVYSAITVTCVSNIQHADISKHEHVLFDKKNVLIR